MLGHMPTAVHKYQSRPTYVPTIGTTPNVSRSGGSTNLIVSHSNTENTAKIDAEAMSSIGGGTLGICSSMCRFSLPGCC